MTNEILEKANKLKDAIIELQCQKSRIQKIYAKREDLTPDQIEEVIQIANQNTDFTLNTLKGKFEKL